MTSFSFIATRLLAVTAFTTMLMGACRKNAEHPEAAETQTVSAVGSSLTWSRAYVVAPAGSAPAVMYLTISNSTAKPDTLLRVTTPLVDVATLHENMSNMGNHGMSHEMQHGSMTMVPVTTVVIPADTVYRFAPGGTHVMLTHPKRTIVRGDSVEFTLHFSVAGALSGKAAVINYADVDTATAVHSPTEPPAATVATASTFKR